MSSEWTAVVKATDHFKDLPISEEERHSAYFLFNQAYNNNSITVDMLDTRQRRLIETNALISNLLRRNFNITVELLGKMFKKHHATILHYTKLHDQVLMADNKYFQLYRKLDEEVKLTKKQNMYLTVLNFETGRVFQYQFQHMSRVDKEDVDSEQWEEFIIDEGHRLDSCQWMVHEQGQVIRDVKHHKDLG
jgi:hypothetical protein